MLLGQRLGELSDLGERSREIVCLAANIELGRCCVEREESPGSGRDKDRDQSPTLHRGVDDLHLGIGSHSVSYSPDEVVRCIRSGRIDSNDLPPGRAFAFNAIDQVSAPCVGERDNSPGELYALRFGGWELPLVFDGLLLTLNGEKRDLS